MARRADARAVLRPAPARHRAAGLIAPQPREAQGHVPVRGLRASPCSLPAPSSSSGTGWPSFDRPASEDAVSEHEDLLTLHATHRGTLCPLRRPSRPRLPRRAPRDDGPALLHQRRRAQVQAGGRLTLPASTSWEPRLACRGGGWSDGETWGVDAPASRPTGAAGAGKPDSVSESAGSTPAGPTAAHRLTRTSRPRTVFKKGPSHARSQSPSRPPIAPGCRAAARVLGPPRRRAGRRVRLAARARTGRR